MAICGHSVILRNSKQSDDKVTGMGMSGREQIGRKLWAAI